MLRSPQPRPVSPANTTFSGISSYRSESYRRVDAKGAAPNVPAIDPRIVAKTHFEELTVFLASHISKESQGSRTNAREKLTKLTAQQFQELSTDVYDELVRRKNNSSKNEVPFLPVREDFHPKRNQARQKLATLPQLRFKDLSSDVYYELGRRYPEFKEELQSPAPQTPASPGSAYDDSSAPPSAQTIDGTAPNQFRGDEINFGDRDIKRRPSRGAEDNPPPPPPTYAAGRRSQDTERGDDRERERERQQPVNPYRRPSQDSNSNTNSTLRSSERERYQPNNSLNSSTGPGRRPSNPNNVMRPSERERERDPPVRIGSPPPPSTAKSGVIIPNKSTIAEEDPIEVPFGDSGSSGTKSAFRDSRERDEDTDFGGESESEYGRSPAVDRNGISPISGGPGGGGLSGLARLGGGQTPSSATAAGDESDIPTGFGTGNNLFNNSGTKSGDEYYDKLSSFGRANSVASDRSRGGGTRSDSKLSRNDSQIDRDREDLKREYEFKIATLQKKASGSEERVKVMEEELAELRERAEDYTSSMRSLQRDLDDLRSERRRIEEEKDREVRNWRERYERSEEERERERRDRMDEPNEDDSQLIEQLQGDLKSLLNELTELQSRNEELMSAKEESEAVLGDSEDSAREWKRKYEQAKTELRGLKATSQLFLQTPDFEDTQSIPINSDGGVLDIHITAFQSAIDSLLTIGRSSSPSKVLTPMKTVVDAASAMLEDVRAYERRPPRGADLDSVRTLHERLEDTLSNLVIAAKNHAQSYGLSPVSLLDAAASHVSTTVVELAKCVYIRRSTKAEQDAFASAPPTSSLNLALTTPMSPGMSSMSGMSGMNGFSPKLRSVDELRTRNSGVRQRNGSTGGSSLRGEMSPPPPSSRVSGNRSGTGSATTPTSAKHRQAPSEPSSSSGSMSPPIFDTPLATSVSNNAVANDEIGLPENPDDVWNNEVRRYLEAQSEQLVYAIQSVLSAVRAPTPPPSLNDHLTQVITIVTSIVAVCKDGVPPSSSAAAVNQLLRELSENCDRLSELQALPPDKTNKETRQQMAKASFQVANAMKSLLRI